MSPVPRPLLLLMQSTPQTAAVPALTIGDSASNHRPSENCTHRLPCNLRDICLFRLCSRPGCMGVALLVNAVNGRLQRADSSTQHASHESWPYQHAPERSGGSQRRLRPQSLLWPPCGAAVSALHTTLCTALMTCAPAPHLQHTGIGMIRSLSGVQSAAIVAICSCFFTVNSILHT